MEYRFLGNSGFRVPVLGFGTGIFGGKGPLFSAFVANQAYYSLVGRDYEWELMPLGLDQGMGAVVWSPLGGGWN